MTFQHMMQYDLLLSCDSILKSDRYCQLFGSRSNSLNSCKFPGCFSYGLETRLTQSGMKGKQEEISVSKGRNQGLCVVLDLIHKHDTE